MISETEGSLLLQLLRSWFKHKGLDCSTSRFWVIGPVDAGERKREPMATKRKRRRRGLCCQGQGALTVINVRCRKKGNGMCPRGIDSRKRETWLERGES